jgi:replicative DNA helicase
MECYERVGRLLCPKCGTDGSLGAIRYVETVERWRPVLEVKDGRVWIDGADEIVKGSERDPYLQCLAETAAGDPCGHRWPVRSWLRQNIATADPNIGPITLDAEGNAVRRIPGTEEAPTSQPIGEALRAAFRPITEAAERGQRITGISTGFETLDAETSGLQVGDLTIVAAHRGMGLTSFALSLATNVAAPCPVPAFDDDAGDRREPFGVCVFSLDVPRDHLALRMACAKCRVDLRKVRGGFLQPDDWRRLTEAASFIAGLPVWIDAPGALDLDGLRAKARGVQVECARASTPDVPEPRLGLIVIDALQLMTAGASPGRDTDLGELVRGLKQVAQELSVHVLALLQLRDAERARPRRPRLADLHQLGVSDADADAVVFLHRDAHTNAAAESCIAEVILAKQRRGPRGQVALRFTPSCGRFDNLVADSDSDLAGPR